MLSSKTRTLVTLLCLGFLVVACASKETEPKTEAQNEKEGIVNEEETRAPAEEDVEQEPSSSEEEPVVESTPELFFTRLQILSEVVEGEACDEGHQRIDEVDEPFVVELVESDASAELAFFEGLQAAPRESVLNVSIRSIGFDELRYRFSVVDEELPVDIAYDIGFDVRPNGLLNFAWAEESRQLRLDRTPIYSFSVEEQRGEECVVVHNVNVFGEKTGYYEVSDSEF